MFPHLLPGCQKQHPDRFSISSLTTGYKHFDLVPLHVFLLSLSIVKSESMLGQMFQPNGLYAHGKHKACILCMSVQGVTSSLTQLPAVCWTDVGCKDLSGYWRIDLH